ncbi:uncharacterized protein LOC116298460 isoform X2 [Actinia tenebrosa]|uniref:Uncharacterized protein LOC116298460 isoform X2 n=1 Tax=Actinia tenebrosa TaxID=6105 RepID=A0A6P8IBF8_ACTTE|nr:uncharacterized protein LOC116298460 isoform X2 [Actinia tenebrosa]
MAKWYFAAAIVVGGIAVALFLLYNVRELDDLSRQKTDQETGKKPVIDPPQERPQDRQESPDTKDGKRALKDEKLRDKQTSKQDSKADKKDNEEPEIPKGHLKYLGEHGSPIITGEIEEVDFVPNGKDFYTHFARKRKPLIMRGAISHWPAVKHWANETYLRENYGDVIFDVQLTKKYETILPIKKTMTLNEYLDIYKKENVYLDCPFPQSKMTRDILVPYCLQCNEISEGISSTHLLFSNGNTSSSLHYDGYENLLSVISGTKEILVANYSYADSFYNRNYTTVNIEAPIDPEAVDLIKYPKLAEVPFHKVTIHAGDILYIPQTWWHHVRSFESPNIAISLWFGIFKSDPNQETNAEEIESETMDPVKFIEQYGECVNKAPETIDCVSQNRPISEVFWPKENGDVELPKIPDPESWTVTLNSGYKMPIKGFGTAGLLKESEAATLVALNTGYRLIDTAQVDGYNETAVGCALKASGIPREEVFLVSKVVPRNMGYEDTIASVDQTLEKLQTSYVDLMLIHAPDCEKEDDGPFSCPEGYPRGTWRDCWKGLEELVKKGKVRSIGVSNFYVKDLKELMEIATIPPAVVQNFFTPFYHDKQTRKYCQENNIKYMGFSTLGNMYVREGFDVNPVLTDEGIKHIAQSYDASPAQVVLKWALESDVIVIPQSRNPNHIETNFHLHQIFLSDKDKEYFEKLDGKFEEEQESEVQEETTEKQEPELKKPVRNKDIIDKLDLRKKVNPEDATIYVSSDDQYIYALDAKTGELMWKYGTAEDGGSRCAFSPDESVVYCGTDDHYIRAFDRLDGTLLWKFKTEGAVVSSTGVGTDGTLYVGSLDGDMYAVNKDGSLKWKKHLGDQIWSSPALKDGGRVVFVGSMTDTTSNIFALKGETGESVWDLKTQGPVFSSPALNEDESVMFVCSFDANCYAFDSETGKIAWVFEGDGSFQSSPVLSKSTQTMYVASTEGNVFAVSTKNGKRVWKYQSKGEYFSSPFPAPNGLVYIGSGIGEILALNQSNGQLVWRYKTEMSHPIYSTPKMSKDGVLYVGGIDGYIYAFRSEDGQVVWKFKTNGPLAGTVRITEKHNMPTS